MFETIKTWLAGQNFMVSIASVAIALNLFFSGVSLMLQKADEALKGFMDKTATSVDNNAEAKVSAAIVWLSKITTALQSVADWLSGNRAH